MQKFIKKTLAAAVAVTATLAFAPAQAYVMSSSSVNMTDFVIKNAATNAILDAGAGGDFSFITFTSTADTSAALTGFVTLTGSATNPPTNPIDLPLICLGAACVPAAITPLAPGNTPKPTAPPATGNYSAADQYEEGAPISGLLGFATPANVGQGAWVGLDTGTVDGTATSNNNLNSSFTFTTGKDIAMLFEIAVDAFLQVAVSNDEQFPGFATASYSMSFSILDLGTGSTVFTFAPDLFGDGTNTLSLNAPLPINVEVTRDTSGPKAFSATTPVLSSGTLYQASFRMTSLADAGRQAIPEPSILALLGLSLLGIGVSRYRRRA